MSYMLSFPEIILRLGWPICYYYLNVSVYIYSDLIHTCTYPEFSKNFYISLDIMKE